MRTPTDSQSTTPSTENDTPDLLPLDPDDTPTRRLRRKFESEDDLEPSSDKLEPMRRKLAGANLSPLLLNRRQRLAMAAAVLSTCTIACMPEAPVQDSAEQSGPASSAGATDYVAICSANPRAPHAVTVYVDQDGDGVGTGAPAARSSIE